MRRRRCGYRYIWWRVLFFGVALLGFIFFSFRFLLFMTAVAIIIFAIWLMGC